MANTINISSNNNTITITPQDNNTINTSTTSTPISVTQGSTSVVTVSTPGPQGIQGLQGEGANINTGSLVTTSSFNTFTSSIQTEVDSLTAATSSYITEATDISRLNTFTSSIQTEVDALIAATSSYRTTDTDISSLNTFTGSIQTEVDSLTAATSSYITRATDISSLNTFTSSIQTEVDSLTAATSSYITEATDISSLNTFTGSIQTEVDNLTAATSSYLTSIPAGTISSSAQITITESQISDLSHTNISFLNTFTSSIQTEVNSLTAATSSYLSNPYTGDFIITGSNNSANSHVLTLVNSGGLELLKVENNGEVITEGPLTLNEPNTGNYVTINPNGNPFLYNFKQGIFGGSIMEVNGGNTTFPNPIIFSSKPTFSTEIDVPNIELDSSNSDRSIRFWKMGVAARVTINHNASGDLQFRMFDSYTPTTGKVGMNITQQGNVRISGSLAIGTPNNPQLDQRAVITNSTNAYNDVYGLTLPYVSQPTHMGATKPGGNNYNGQIASGSNEITSDSSSPNYLADYTTNYNVGDILQDFNSDFRGVITSVTATTMSLDVPIAKSYTGSSYTYWPKIVGHNKGTVYYNTNTDKISYWTETQINNLLDSSGSQELTGSLNVSGVISASSFSGDGSGLTGVSVFPFTGSADVTGSSTITGGSDSSDYPFVVKDNSGAPLFRVRSDGYVMFGNLGTDLALDFTGGNRYLKFFNTAISAQGGTGITATGTIGFNPGTGTSKKITFINSADAYGSVHLAQGTAANTTFPNNRGTEILFNREVNHQKYYGVIRGDDNIYQPVPLYIFSGKNTTTYANEPLVLQYYPGAQDGTGSRGNVGIGLENPSTELHVSGAVSASTYYGSNIEINGSGSTLFEVIGSEGQLFSITDSLSGSLFAVSDVSGLPILEVFSDDTIKMGSFNNEALEISGSDINFNNLPTSDPGIPGRLYQTGSDAIGATAGFQVVCISQ